MLIASQRPPRPVLERTGRLAAEEHLCESPGSCSVGCERTGLMRAPDRCYALESAGAAVPGAADSRAREAARARLAGVLQVQRDAIRRGAHFVGTLVRREARRRDIVLVHPRREEEAAGHEPDERHKGDRAAARQARAEEEAGAGRCRADQGQGGRSHMLADARPPTAGLLEGGRDVQEGGAAAGEPVHREDDPMSGVFTRDDSELCRLERCTDRVGL